MEWSFSSIKITICINDGSLASPSDIGYLWKTLNFEEENYRLFMVGNGGVSCGDNVWIANLIGCKGWNGVNGAISGKRLTLEWL